MSDADMMTRRVILDSWPPAAQDVFVAAFNAAGAHTDQQRADLLETSRRNVYRYIHGKTDPKLSTARRIAARLGRDIDELWPHKPARSTRRAPRHTRAAA